MTCANCKKEISVPYNVLRNLETYCNSGDSKVTISECCGIGVIVKMKVSFSIDYYSGAKTEDDWGNDIKLKIK